MQAIICPEYGPPDVLKLAEQPRPTPGPRDLLIRIHATAATRADARIRAADFPRGMGLLARLALGLKRPRNPILGGVFAGEVVEIGANVTQFSPGDRVFGMTGGRLGCYAQFQKLGAQRAVARLPDTISYADAAALPFGFTTAMSFLRDKAKLTADQRVLIVGASGDVGAAAVQIAKIIGAHVTGVCSTANLDLVRNLGANAALDYTRTDPLDGNQKYDVVFDTVGNIPVSHLLQGVAPNGRLLLAAAGLRDMLRRSADQGRRIMSGVAEERADDLALVAQWVTESRYRPLVHQVFPIDQIVAAHRIVSSRRKIGAVVVTLP